MSTMMNNDYIFSKYSQYGIYSVFFLFITGFAFNLERVLCTNELFSLIGCIIFFTLFKKRTYKENSLLLSIYFLIIYGTIRAIFSLAQSDNVYGYLRTLPLLYSIFSFFLGILFFSIIQKMRSDNLLFISAVPVSLLTVFFGNTIASQALLPLLFKNYTYKFILILCLLVFTYFFRHEATTLAMTFIFIVISIIVCSKKLRSFFLHPLFSIFLISSFFLMLIFANIHWNNFYSLGYSVVPMRPDTTWRLMFWSYAFFHNFLLHPLFGIGFGTPIYDINTKLTTFISITNLSQKHYYEYIIGTHNFIIYIMSRLGIIGILPIFIIYITLIESIRKLNLGALSIGLFYCFVFITVGGLCNVVLPTPLYASTYWILLGMLYASIEYDKHNLTVLKNP